MSFDLRLVRRISLGLAALSIATLSSIASAANPSSYPLLCRGGGEVVLEKDPASNDIILKYKFAKSHFSALAKGGCSWADRGLSNQESAAIQMATNSDNERLIIQEVSACLRDPGCVVTGYAANTSHGAWLEWKFNKPFSFKRAP